MRAPYITLEELNRFVQKLPRAERCQPGTQATFYVQRTPEELQSAILAKLAAIDSLIPDRLNHTQEIRFEVAECQRGATSRRWITKAVILI